MTIRDNWCEDCEEICTAHTRCCTMCGGPLTVRPSSSSNSSNQRPPPSFRAMPDLDAFLPAGVSLAGSGLSTADVLATVRQQVQATTALAQQAIDTNNATANGGGGGGGWQTIPEALLDPQGGGGKTPTSKEVLKKLPREVLTAKSACFFQVLVEIDGGENCKGVTGELGPLPSLASKNEIQIKDTPLWTPKSQKQRTGKESFGEEGIPDPPFVALLERGDGISFFKKSYAAEIQGAIAVIIINDKRDPWPYVMKDSRTRSQKDNEGEVSIPTIMVSQSNGREILKKYGNANSNTNANNCSCSITISHNPQEDYATCVVCRESLKVEQTTLTLSNYCGHVFHESCALTWLTNHNTCPYCRRSLPTDETSQEQERRRQMTSSSAAAITGGGEEEISGAQAFYS